MAINLDISENIERIPLSVQSNTSLRAVSSENGSPYYVGARAYVTQTSNGAVVTVIDKDGTTTATILNGVNGASGVGIISITQNADYTLTINLDDGTSYTTEPLKGEDGYTPVKGVDYFDGQDGYTPIKGVDYFDGEDGQDGQNGQDGYTPIKGVDYFDGAKGDTGNGIVSTVLNDDYTLTILFSDGTSVTTSSIRGAKGEAGTTGATGNGIANIAKTSTSGLIDTYTITYTNGATDTFQVKNGENGSGSVADVWVDGTSVLDGDTAKIDLSGKADTADLATVATSGSYNDLANKPTIPSAVTESTVSGWGFTKNTGTYSKPSGGIPKTDLATAVQTSLEKADTALQSYTETDPTVPAWAKEASKPTYTASEVGAVPTTRTVNGKALSSNITLSASDVSALPASTSIGVTEVSASGVSSLPITISNADIIEKHVCVKAVLSNPSAQTDDWTVTTSDGSAVISGSISGTTDITLYLGLKVN